MDDVFNVGIVASSLSITEEGYWRFLIDQSREFVDSHFRALARSINGEESQTRCRDPVEMMVRVTHQLAGIFRRSIRRHRAVDGIVLAKRYLCTASVYGRRRGEQELFDPVEPREFQKVDRAADVYILVQEGIFQRRPYARTRGEMDDPGDWILPECVLQELLIADVSFNEAISAVIEMRADIEPLDGGVVKVIEIV